MVVRGFCRSRFSELARGMLALSVAATFLYFHTLIPQLEQAQTLKSLALRMEDLIPRGETVEYVGPEFPPCDLRFYSANPVRSIAPSSFDLEQARFFLIPDNRLKKLSPRQREELEVLASGPEKAGVRLLLTKKMPF